ncbi:hypothetical protein K4F52_000870 [Lecanicillium sp. MT-2017a]|nr:hypothetical protein K4F52_000870 [Lecanicillium sp. MT-2017a]
MPSDDYKSFGGGGALKLKGAKVDKKKKKKAPKPDLEKNLSAGDEKAVSKRRGSDAEDDKKKNDKPASDNEDERPVVPKTESERRYEETRKKRLLKMAEQSGSRPELLKTHKERVEELNSYLSKLSEHHDMPKIGPG